jgi:hypothetical protein
MAVGQATLMLDAPASSLASQLPQGFWRGVDFGSSA